MSRIDRSLVVDMTDEDMNEFICSICHEIFADPAVTGCCRQIYCNQCINEWLHQNDICPHCRDEMDIEDLTPAPRAFLNLLANIRIKCKFHENGCQSIIRSSEIERHLEDCEFNQCLICRLGRESDPDHNCKWNLKIINESIDLENQRLVLENYKLKKRLKLFEEIPKNIPRETKQGPLEAGASEDPNQIPIIPLNDAKSTSSSVDSDLNIDLE